MIAKSLSVWALNILCHQKGRTFGIEASEQLQRSGIKLIGPPLALYCNRSAAAAGDDEVHFIAALVPPKKIEGSGTHNSRYELIPWVLFFTPPIAQKAYAYESYNRVDSC